VTEPGAGELDPVGPDPVKSLVEPLLQGLQDRPLSEHVEAFDAAHRALQDALVAIDEA
jgi:hypothetical protein